jgi:hypothetical protein
MSFKGGCDFGQLSVSVSGWLPRVVCLSGVNAAANWRRQHLITFLNCATQLLSKNPLASRGFRPIVTQS